VAVPWFAFGRYEIHVLTTNTLHRHGRLLLLAATLLCSTLLGVLAVAAEGPAAPGSGAQIGLQVHPLWSGADRATAAGQIEAAADAGAQLVRIDVGWASVEQEGKGRWSSWYLHRLDAAVDAARRRGLRVLLTVTGTPCWASSAPKRLRQRCHGAWWQRGVERYAPRRAADYGDALGFLARRYRGRVDAWEIWNEPNQRAFLRAPDPAAAYARMLRRAYPAIKAAAPGATVVGGSLAEADRRFTDRLYRHGVKNHFDAWSVHPYSGDRSPLDPGASGDAEHSFVRGVPAVRRAMLAHGDDKPLWLTELGWTTSSTRSGPGWARGVDPERQAKYLIEAFEQLRAWDYVDVAVWYTLRDTSADEADRDSNFGLLERDGRPKPSHAAFERIARG